MLKRLMRKLHTPLQIVHDAQGTAKDSVVFLPEGKNPPRWARINDHQSSDFAETKSLWLYSKAQYDRTLLISYKRDLVGAAVKAISALKARKIREADFILPKEMKQDQIDLLANSAILANYAYQVKGTVQVTEDEEEKTTELDVEVINLKSNVKYDTQLSKKSEYSAVCALFARDLSNMRGSECTPEYLCSQAEQLVRVAPHTHLEVLRGPELQERGLHLLYSVGKAASCPAHLAVLSYTPHPSNAKLAIIGKGVTFDTGGLNLKPSNSIENMYLDKGGACAALAVFKWVTELQLPVNLVCGLALAENAVSSLSYKPSDVLTSLKGLTVEIGNTDAEGRLCLADAFTYIQNKEKPSVLIDLATLTGACVVALGEQTAGLFSNNKKLSEALKDSGTFYRENLWELPIKTEHRRAIKGDTADLCNKGKTRYGGASTAAAFLERFIEKDVKWAHLDIAGPAMSSKPWRAFSRGGTGFGVQTLTRYIQEHWVPK